MLGWHRLFSLSLALTVMSVACKQGRELDLEDGGGPAGDASDRDGSPGAGGRAGIGGRGGTSGTGAGGMVVGGMGAGGVGAGGLGVGGMGTGGIGAGSMGTGGRGGAGGTGMGGMGVGGSGTAGTGAGGKGTGGTAVGGTGMGGMGVGGMGTGGSPPPPPFLSSSQSFDFGGVEINVASTAKAWNIVNSGGPTTGAPSVTNSDPAQLVLSNGCTTALATSGQCTIMIAFKAGGLGARNASVTVSAGGSSITFSATATGLYRYTVVKAGGGTGTVTSSVGALNCGSTCSFLTDGNVTLQARTTNGSSTFFSGWSGGGCSGPFRDCAPTFPPTGPVTFTATFSSMSANLIFISSVTTSAALGNTATYDKVCNDAATAAGINETSGTAFTAMVSTTTSLARGRLTTRPQGWLRMDGKPFANSQTALFTNQQVFNNIQFTEQGGFNGAAIMTGTNSDGTLWTMNGGGVSTNCKDFTDLTDNAGFGGADRYGGAFGWLDDYSWACAGATQVTLICMGNTRVAPVTPIVTAGKKIWLSNTPFVVGGTQTPNALCIATRPAGVTGAAALLATTTTSAASVLSMTANYVRPDGTFVATGAALASTSGVPFSNGEPLSSGIWQSGDGVYRQYLPSKTLVWTGQTSLTAVGTAATTCNNWTDPSNGTAVMGGFTTTLGNYWNFLNTFCGGEMNPIYCVEFP